MQQGSFSYQSESVTETETSLDIIYYWELGAYEMMEQLKVRSWAGPWEDFHEGTENWATWEAAPSEAFSRAKLAAEPGKGRLAVLTWSLRPGF